MNPLTRRVSVAVLAALTVATACLAADPSAAPGTGGIGAQIGASYFRPDRAIGADWFADYSSGAESRFSFAAHWRYTMSRSWRWQIGPGYTWAAYADEIPAPFRDLNFPDDADKDHYLTQLLPISAQLQYTIRRGAWIYYGGMGPGVYRVWVQNQRKVLKDPESLKLHRGLYPGASAQFGVERFLKNMPSVSLEGSFGGHLVMAQRDEQFPSGINSNLMALELRIGANYYFAPGDRKKTTELPQTGTP